MAPTVRMTGPLDPRAGWEATDCSIAKATELLSTRSTFLLLREAFYGATRFDEFASRVGISDPVAATRLRSLVNQGLLARQDYQEPGQRTRSGYVITDKGAELFPVIVALMQWGDRWLAEDDGPVEFRHRGCAHPIHAELRCSADHPVGDDEVDLALKPARRRALDASSRRQPKGSLRHIPDGSDPTG